LTVAVPHHSDNGGTSTKAGRRNSYNTDSEAATVAAASAAAVAASGTGGATATAGATDDNNTNTGGDSHTDRYRAAVRAELDPSQLSPTSRRRMIDRERKRLVVVTKHFERYTKRCL
jgi:hypothetical protein